MWYLNSTLAHARGTQPMIICSILRQANSDLSPKCLRALGLHRGPKNDDGDELSHPQERLLLAAWPDTVVVLAVVVLASHVLAVPRAPRGILLGVQWPERPSFHRLAASSWALIPIPSSLLTDSSRIRDKWALGTARHWPLAIDVPALPSLPFILSHKPSTIAILSRSQSQS